MWWLRRRPWLREVEQNSRLGKGTVTKNTIQRNKNDVNIKKNLVAPWRMVGSQKWNNFDTLARCDEYAKSQKQNPEAALRFS